MVQDKASEFGIITKVEPTKERLKEEFPRYLHHDEPLALDAEKDFHACKPEAGHDYFVFLLEGDVIELPCVFPGSRIPDVIELQTLADRRGMRRFNVRTYRPVPFLAEDRCILCGLWSRGRCGKQTCEGLTEPDATQAQAFAEVHPDPEIKRIAQAIAEGRATSRDDYKHKLQTVRVFKITLTLKNKKAELYLLEPPKYELFQAALNQLEWHGHEKPVIEVWKKFPGYPFPVDGEVNLTFAGPDMTLMGMKTEKITLTTTDVNATLKNFRTFR